MPGVPGGAPGVVSGIPGLTDGKNGNIVTTTPHLGGGSDNGGPTVTVSLLAGSPAIDAGDDAVCDSTGRPLDVNRVDQRGVSRYNGAHCDIGAFEVIPPSAPKQWSQVTNQPSYPGTGSSDAPPPSSPPAATAQPGSPAGVDLWNTVRNTPDLSVPTDLP